MEEDRQAKAGGLVTHSLGRVPTWTLEDLTQWPGLKAGKHRVSSPLDSGSSECDRQTCSLGLL